MTLSRRKTLALIGGGVILAAAAMPGAIATRQPRIASLPLGQAGLGEDARHRALSYALLAPNPHNRQPWLVDLREAGLATLHVDAGKLLPQAALAAGDEDPGCLTDPQARRRPCSPFSTKWESLPN